MTRTIPLGQLLTSRTIKRSEIEWCDYAVGSPFVFRHKKTGAIRPNLCVKVSSGCANCYAETMMARFHHGVAYTRAVMEEHECLPDWSVIHSILKFRHKGPYKHGRKRPFVFLGDSTDVYGEWVRFDLLDILHAAMALRPDVDFGLLTKRPERAVEYYGRDRLESAGRHGSVMGAANFQLGYENASIDWPLPNVWHGASVENQEQADKRIPWLLKLPGKPWLSCEPLLGPISLDRVAFPDGDRRHKFSSLNACGYMYAVSTDKKEAAIIELKDAVPSRIAWVIGGGESGRGARPTNIEHHRSLRKQCRDAGVPYFQKQLGSHVICPNDHVSDWNDDVPSLRIEWPEGNTYQGDLVRVRLNDRKGGDMAEWPEDLRVREVPA